MNSDPAPNENISQPTIDLVLKYWQFVFEYHHSWKTCGLFT